jgi:hypothetical protein
MAIHVAAFSLGNLLIFGTVALTVPLLLLSAMSSKS